jgi:hypothetical protein
MTFRSCPPMIYLRDSYCGRPSIALGDIRRSERVSGLTPALAPARPVGRALHTHRQRTPRRRNCLILSGLLLLPTRSLGQTRPHSRSCSPSWSPESPSRHPVSYLSEGGATNRERHEAGSRLLAQPTQTTRQMAGPI